MLDLSLLSPAACLAVLAALDLLRRAALDRYYHVLANVVRIEHMPSDCPGWATACTGAHLGRRVVFVTAPETLPLVELAVIIAHEANHHGTLPDGQHVLIHHECSDGGCSVPWERESDPIYRGDERLRARLNQYIAQTCPPPAKRSSVAGPLFAVAGVFLVATVGVSLLR